MAWKIQSTHEISTPKEKRTNLNKKTFDLFSDAGWKVSLTQSFNHITMRSSDMFGFIDLMMFVPGSPIQVAVQACATSSKANRRSKILSLRDAYDWVRGAASNRLIWIVHWHKEQVSELTKSGKRKKIFKWVSNLEIIQEGDFNKCLVNLWEDADPHDALTSHSIMDQDSVKSTVKKTTDAKDKSDKSSKNVIAFTIPKRG